MLTKEQKKCVDFLESLVHSRTRIEVLQRELSEHFKENVKLEDCTPDDLSDGCSDFNLIFELKGEEVFGYFDIYFLKMRKPGRLYDENIFITEIGHEFE